MSAGRVARVVLAKRPAPNAAVTLDCFRVERSPTTTAADGVAYTVGAPTATGAIDLHPPLPPGSVAVETLFQSVDPYMRCRFNDDTGADYIAPYALNEPLESGGVGIVRASTHSDYAIGALVGGDTLTWRWQQYNVFTAPEALPQPLPPLLQPANASLALGALGVTGLTAYFAIAAEAESVLSPGEGARRKVLVVSSAAGATGSVACQLGKVLFNAFVIGLTSTDAKCATLTADCRCDVAINYTQFTGPGELAAEIRRHLPASDGAAESAVDCYLDHVGGAISDDVITTMATGGRVVLCGQISTYDKDVPYPPPIPAATQQILHDRQISRDRYIVLKYAERFPEAVGALAKLYGDGALVCKETVVPGGYDAAPAAFIDMMQGRNVGKMVVNTSQ